MTAIYDCSVDSQLLTGMRLARGAIGRGELVVIPTDTVYGVAADAFDAAAVARLLEAKGRERTSPPPVLIPGIPTLDALASEVPERCASSSPSSGPAGSRSSCTRSPRCSGTSARRAAPWRCACRPTRSRSSCSPRPGPLAVSSREPLGQPSATTAADAEADARRLVAVYLDGGPAGECYEAIGERPGDTSSTIVDATGHRRRRRELLRIVRAGVISRERIAAVVGEDMLAPEPATPRPCGARRRRRGVTPRPRHPRSRRTAERRHRRPTPSRGIRDPAARPTRGIRPRLRRRRAGAAAS